MLVLYFYSWFKLSYLYALLYAPLLPTTQTYVWHKKVMQLLLHEEEEEEEEEEKPLYYVLIDGSILVFKDALVRRQVVALLQKEGPAALHRRPFRYFMEAESSSSSSSCSNILPLLTRYDNGHGTFFKELTHYAPRPSELFDFDRKRFVCQNNEVLRVVPLATLEPQTVSPGQPMTT
jgi:hypothetical protein